MLVFFSPQVRGGQLVVSKAGDALTINGHELDFSPLPEGGVLPATAVACEDIVGDVMRVEGRVVLTLVLPIAWDAPYEARFPAALVDPPDGLLALPGAAQ